MARCLSRMHNVLTISGLRACTTTTFDFQHSWLFLWSHRSALPKQYHASISHWMQHKEKESVIRRGHPERCPETKLKSGGLVQDIPWDVLEESNSKMVGLSKRQQRELLRRKPRQPENPHLCKVAIIGAPNAGKSTLANKLIGWRFAAVSSKVHTTRHKAVGVLTEKNKQVVFLDTPGVISEGKMRRHKLQMSMLVDPHSCLCEADLIVVLVDVSQVWFKSSLHVELLKALRMHRKKKSILVLNKVDLVRSKMELLHITRMLTAGVVGGQRDWHTTKVKSAPSYDTLVSRMRDHHKKKLAAENAGHRMLDSGICDNAPERFRNKSWPSEANKVDCMELNTATLESYCQEATETRASDQQALRVKAGLDLNIPAEWQLYKYQLDKRGAEVEDIQGWNKFERVFMISALSGDGVEDLREHLLSSTQPGNWLYHQAVVTDQDPVELARHCIWEKLMEYLPKEIPYVVSVEMAEWIIDEDNVLRAKFNIICSNKRHMVHTLGKRGEIVKKIAEDSKAELMNTFRRDMSLKLAVTIKKPMN